LEYAPYSVDLLDEVMVTPGKSAVTVTCATFAAFKALTLGDTMLRINKGL